MILLLVGFISCKKFLDKKPEQALFVPSTPADLQAVLDQTARMNIGAFGNAFIELIADDYYVNSANWQNATFTERQNYIWEGEDSDFNNWQIPYINPIYTCNAILDQLAKIEKGNNLKANEQVEGAALFLRAFGFFQLAQVYCKPYSSNAENDLGVVLRQTVDVETKANRSSVSETYSKIINDLIRASELLPENSVYSTRPSKVSAYAMLARVYLAMRDYENALKFSDMALILNNRLLDFNDLVLTNTPIFPTFINNPEILFFSSMTGPSLVNINIAKIDTNLYRSYHTDDLRKNVFFLQNTGLNTGTYKFRGSYYAQSNLNLFNGLTTAELYLIKAECLARRGSVSEAISALNLLLKRRYNRTGFVERTAASVNEAKTLIIEERRKELIFRGQRWSDLRRFNLEGANITLKRILNGTSYTLPPNDPRWVMPIPIQEINLSGIQQNPK